MAEIGSKGKLKRYYSSRQRKKSPAHRRNYVLMAKLSTEANYMARLQIIYVIGDFALTPLGGLETRPVSNVTTLGFATLGLLHRPCTEHCFPHPSTPPLQTLANFRHRRISTL